MSVEVLQAIGGLGLFLLGMLVLTDGLKALAGESAHRVLYRFTNSPTSGAVTGACMTAVLQSSSVTTVATVGMVSAGLLAFPQALGIMFGANIGTTAKGWIVALLGFHLDIGLLVMPVLLAGVLLRMFGRGRLGNAGWALAGFALLFIGIEGMQAGMSAFQGIVTPDDFPPDTFVGRLALVGIGIVVTLVTQSSSAGVAAALTAVDAGTLTFAQAAAMVIGMDVGTTSTTAIATIGGSAQTRRTGYAHVVYNLMTAVGAFLLLDPYTRAVDALFEGGTGGNATLALVGFHSTFNTLGVIAVLPFTGAFARLMERLVREREPSLVDGLDTKLLREPTAAALALPAVVRRVAAELFEDVSQALDPAHDPEVDEEHLARVTAAVRQAREYAGRIALPPENVETARLVVAALHAIDHLERLVRRCRRDDRIGALRTHVRLRELSGVVREALDGATRLLRDEDEPRAVAGLRAARDAVRAERQPFRRTVLAAVPAGKLALDEALRRLDAMRWLHRTVYHAWRIVTNLEPGLPASDPLGPTPPAAPPAGSETGP